MGRFLCFFSFFRIWLWIESNRIEWLWFFFLHSIPVFHLPLMMGIIYSTFGGASSWYIHPHNTFGKNIYFRYKRGVYHHHHLYLIFWAEPIFGQKKTEINKKIEKKTNRKKTDTNKQTKIIIESINIRKYHFFCWFFVIVSLLEYSSTSLKHPERKDEHKHKQQQKTSYKDKQAK